MKNQHTTLTSKTITGVDEQVLPYVLNYFLNQGIRFTLDMPGEISGKGWQGTYTRDNDANEITLHIQDGMAADQLAENLSNVVANAREILVRSVRSVTGTIINLSNRPLSYVRFERSSGILDGIPTQEIAPGSSGTFRIINTPGSVATGAIGTVVYQDYDERTYSFKASVPFIGSNSSDDTCPSSVMCTNSISGGNHATATFLIENT